jgi:hypothetical protein
VATRVWNRADVEDAVVSHGVAPSRLSSRLHSAGSTAHTRVPYVVGSMCTVSRTWLGTLA